MKPQRNIGCKQHSADGIQAAIKAACLTRHWKNEEILGIIKALSPERRALLFKALECLMPVGKPRRRKSSPTTIHRNVQICDLRKQDVRKWSLGKLSQKFGITKQAIFRIVKDEEKWRRSADQLSTN